MSALRRTLKYAAYEACCRSGANWLLRQFRARNGLLILIYHGVVAGDHSHETFLYRNTVSAREFEGHLQILKRLFTPVSAADVLTHYEGGCSLPPRPLLVTFDDGYHNNLTQAAPLLLKHGIPALFHITTGYIGRPEILWPDEVNLRVLGWTRPQIPFPASDGCFPHKDVPNGQEARIGLAQSIRSLSKSLPEEVRLEYMRSLRASPCPLLDRSEEHTSEFQS